jgi:hypothetical protein
LLTSAGTAAVPTSRWPWPPRRLRPKAPVSAEQGRVDRDLEISCIQRLADPLAGQTMRNQMTAE